MANEKPKAAAKPKAAKATAPKADAPKAAKAAPATKAPKAAPSGATVTVRQIGSKIGRRADQEATLIGLGLNKRHRVRTLKDTPEVRGMIYKVRHLVEVVN